MVTYAEVLTGARLGHHDEDRVRGFFSQLISKVLPVDMTVADKAAEFRSRFKSLRMPDALILATAATTSEVDLMTGDAQAPKVPGLGWAVVCCADASCLPFSVPLERRIADPADLTGWISA